MLRPVRSLLSSTVVIVTTLAIVFSLSSVFSTLSILPSMVFSVIFPCLRPFFRFFSPFFSFFLCFFLFFGWLIANRLLSLRLSLLFWLRFKLAGSWGWSRRLLFFDWISDYNSNFLKMTIMNLLNNRDLIYFSFFVDYILPHYNNLISVCLSIFHFLFNCFFSILSNKSTQTLLQFIVIGCLFQYIADVDDCFIQVGALNILEASPQFIEFGVLRELWVGQINCKSSGKQVKFFELMGSEELYIFEIGLLIEGDSFLKSGPLLNEVVFAVDLFNLFRFEVFLLLELADFGEPFVQISYFFVDHSQEGLILLVYSLVLVLMVLLRTTLCLF